MILKLPAHRAGLPGKEDTLFIAAPYPPYEAGLAGCAPGQRFANKAGNSADPAIPAARNGSSGLLLSFNWIPIVFGL